MTEAPRIEQREAQPYAAIRTRVTMAQIPEACPPLIGQVAEWLGSRGLSPSGPPFFRYAAFEGEHEVIDVGFPMARAPEVGDGRVTIGVFPAGRYLSLRYWGHYSGIGGATKALLAHGDAEGVAWDASADGSQWGARIEWYPTDPMAEPDPAKWLTEIAIRLRD